LASTLGACGDGGGEAATGEASAWIVPAEGAAPGSTLGTGGGDGCGADTGAALVSTLVPCGDGDGVAATGEASA
jgi:hypothetical protein